MSFNKTVFNHSVITSQFLNDLQDELIEVGGLARSRQYPQLLLYDEADKLVPVDEEVSGYHAKSLWPQITPIVGDIVIGLSTKHFGYITAVGPNSFYVQGMDMTLGEAMPR